MFVLFRRILFDGRNVGVSGLQYRLHVQRVRVEVHREELRPTGMACQLQRRLRCNAQRNGFRRTVLRLHTLRGRVLSAEQQRNERLHGLSERTDDRQHGVDVLVCVPQHLRRMRRQKGRHVRLYVRDLSVGMGAGQHGRKLQGVQSATDAQRRKLRRQQQQRRMHQ